MTNFDEVMSHSFKVRLSFNILPLFTQLQLMNWSEVGFKIQKKLLYFDTKTPRCARSALN